MSRSLLKSIDPTAGSAIASLIKDMDDFKNKIQSMIDVLYPTIVEHYTKTEVLARIHKITSQEELMKFEVQVLPPDSMKLLAQTIDAAYHMDPLHIKTLIYTEVMTHLGTSGTAYVREQLRQRLQVLANEQKRVIVPTRKIIT